MPSKNTIKIYVENGIYHLYNRGVEKRDIFIDGEDYKIFLHYLKSYLTPPKFQKNIPKGIRVTGIDNYDLYNKIQLLAYCLMPNHFHFIIKQLTEKAIIEFMKRLSNAYVKYFNTKYERIGPLFQGPYKGILIDKESYHLHLSRYIHLNPLELFKNPGLKELNEYSYSSYPDYCGKRNTSWVKKDEILEYFKTQKGEIGKFHSYQDFVENYLVDSGKILGELALE